MHENEMQQPKQFEPPHVVLAPAQASSMVSHCSNCGLVLHLCSAYDLYFSRGRPGVNKRQERAQTRMDQKARAQMKETIRGCAFGVGGKNKVAAYCRAGKAGLGKGAGGGGMEWEGQQDYGL